MNIKTALLSIITILSFMPCHAQKKQHGKASYYSKRSTGARTASGQKLHHDSLTCAHRFYPFGTILKVTNLNNNKSVLVKVIDRGPFGRGRIIDLTWAAAKAIGMLAQGVATVKVEPQENPIPYRPEDAKLPRIDFEMAETNFNPNGQWKKEEKEQDKNKQERKQQDKRHASNTHNENQKSINANAETLQNENKNKHKNIEPNKKVTNNSKLKQKDNKHSEGMLEKLRNWGTEFFTDKKTGNQE